MRELSDQEMQMRQEILAVLQRHMANGMHATDVTITAMTLAVNCAESCVVAALSHKREEVREKLVETFEHCAAYIADFDHERARSEFGLPNGNTGGDDGESAWNARR